MGTGNLFLFSQHGVFRFRQYDGASCAASPFLSIKPINLPVDVLATGWNMLIVGTLKRDE
jgi:hypothetical protein